MFKSVIILSWCMEQVYRSEVWSRTLVEDMCLEQVCGAGVWRVTVWSWSEAGVV